MLQLPNIAKHFASTILNSGMAWLPVELVTTIKLLILKVTTIKFSPKEQEKKFKILIFKVDIQVEGLRRHLY